MAREQLKESLKLAPPPKNVGGRPAFVPTAVQREFVEQMVSYGATHKEIAAMFTMVNNGKAISHDTLTNYFREELDYGLTKANMKVAQSLFQQAVGAPPVFNYKIDPKTKKRTLVLERPAIAPNLGAQIWWEKTRRGFKEGMALEVSGKDGQPLMERTIIVLPSNGRELPGHVDNSGRVTVIDGSYQVVDQAQDRAKVNGKGKAVAKTNRKANGHG